MNKRSLIFSMAAAALCVLSQPLMADQTSAPSYIGASSTLEGGNYTASNIQDYNANTAWVEGADGNGIGEYLTMQVPDGAVITGGVIFTGYQKSLDLFYKNAAPSKLRFSTGGEEQYVNLYDAADTYYGNEGIGYNFMFDRPLVSDGYIMVEIEDVRPGWMYEDTCISELRLSGVIPEEMYEYNGYEYTFLSETDSLEISVTKSSMLASFAGQVYRMCREDEAPEDDFYADVWDLDAMQQAFILYWYQYNYSDERIYQSTDGYNYAHESDMEDIAGEFFGEAEDDYAYDTFRNNYVEKSSGDIIYMNGTGDFGDAGEFYFEYPTKIDTEESDDEYIVTVCGNILWWDQYKGTYIKANEYEATFIASEPEHEYDRAVFTFDELHVG